MVIFGDHLNYTQGSLIYFKQIWTSWAKIIVHILANFLPVIAPEVKVWCFVTDFLDFFLLMLFLSELKEKGEIIYRYIHIVSKIFIF